MSQENRRNIFGKYEPRPAPAGGRHPSEPTRPDLAIRPRPPHGDRMTKNDPDEIIPSKPPPPPPPDAAPDVAPLKQPPAHAPSRRKSTGGRIPTPPHGSAIVIKDRLAAPYRGCLASTGYLGSEVIR